jgi:hypothetical protein
MKKLLKLLEWLDGWKSVLSYIALHFLGAYPLVLGAAKKVISNPEDTAAWVELLVQGALALGIADRVRKNLGFSLK